MKFVCTNWFLKMLCIYTVRTLYIIRTYSVRTLYRPNTVKVQTVYISVQNYASCTYTVCTFELWLRWVCTDFKLYWQLQVWPSTYTVHHRAWTYSVCTLYVRVWASTSRVSGFQMVVVRRRWARAAAALRAPPDRLRLGSEGPWLPGVQWRRRGESHLEPWQRSISSVGPSISVYYDIEIETFDIER